MYGIQASTFNHLAASWLPFFSFFITIDAPTPRSIPARTSNSPALTKSYSIAAFQNGTRTELLMFLNRLLMASSPQKPVLLLVSMCVNWRIICPTFWRFIWQFLANYLAHSRPVSVSGSVLCQLIRQTSPFIPPSHRCA